MSPYFKQSFNVVLFLWNFDLMKLHQGNANLCPVIIFG